MDRRMVEVILAVLLVVPTAVAATDSERSWGVGNELLGPWFPSFRLGSTTDCGVAQVTSFNVPSDADPGDTVGVSAEAELTGSCSERLKVEIDVDLDGTSWAEEVVCRNDVGSAQPGNTVRCSGFFDMPNHDTRVEAFATSGSFIDDDSKQVVDITEPDPEPVIEQVSVPSRVGSGEEFDVNVEVANIGGDGQLRVTASRSGGGSFGTIIEHVDAGDSDVVRIPASLSSDSRIRVDADAEGGSDSEVTGTVRVVQDSDGDGVPDPEDDFPYDPDCVRDSDGDGVCDQEDAFPRDPDASRDADGDGVADTVDACRNEAGPERFDGCPDSDGDGVHDGVDACPGESGTGLGVDTRGCPVTDMDNDGVADGDDQCQGTRTGVAVDDAGCPVDSDGDGVPDFRDACPDKGRSQLGLTSDGCPAQDRDGDRILDNRDECPEAYGSKENGCPTIIDSIINTIESFGLTIRQY